MPQESVLSIAEKEAIKIEQLIFHIILKDDVKPHFLDVLEITKEQEKFFKDRLAESAQGRQYIFSDEESRVYQLSQKIILDPSSFLEVSKELTDRFKSTHPSTSNDGVFVISFASIHKRELIFMIKLDHVKVYEYKLKGTKALLEEVKNTFVEDKSAIQKVALVDISKKVAWDVLVYDRSKPSSITDYFGNFLNVLPRETESDLTKNAMSFARKWASENKDKIDPNQNPAQYKNRAVEYLSGTDLFATDDYVNYVIHDENKDRRKILKESFKEFIAEKGLAGQTFKPNKNALTRKVKRHIRETAEGVKIEWDGDYSEKNIEIPNNPDQNGQYKISIRTSDVFEIQ